MYHNFFKIMLVSDNTDLECILKKVAFPEDSEVIFSTVREQSITEAVDGRLDCAVIVDNKESSLTDDLFSIGCEVVYLTAADKLTGLDRDRLAKTDDLWVVPDSLDESLLLTYFTQLLARMKEKADARRKEICFRTLIDSVPDMVWFKNTSGAHLIVNDEFCKVVHKTKEQIYGQGHCYIWNVPREEEKVCLESDNAVMQARKTCVFEEKVKKNDEIGLYKCYKSALIDKDGTIFGSCGMAHDVTDMGNIGRELSIVLESMPFAVLIEDKDGIVIDKNSKFNEYFPYDEDIIGKSSKRWKQLILSNKVIGEDNAAELKVRVGNKDRILLFYEEPILDIFHKQTGKMNIMRDVTLERQYALQTQLMANTDFLTGVNNRRSLFKYLNNFQNYSLSMIMLDLDNFKKANDTYGHAAGDEVLVETTKIMQNCFPRDFIARLGGDEFLIVLRGVESIDQLKAMTEELLGKLNNFYTQNSRFKEVSASAGICMSSMLKTDKDKTEELIRASDAALYQAKRKGKACYCVYGEE